MMRRSKKNYHPSAIEQAGQRAWNEAYGFHREQARRWFMVGVGSLAVAAVALGGWIKKSSETTLVPYVVKEDHHGSTIAVDRLVADQPGMVRTRGHMKTWVEGFRAVSADATTMQKLAQQTYAWIDQTTIAKDQLDTWYIAHNPRERVKKVTVDVDVKSVLPLGSGDVFQIDWTETEWPREAGHQPKLSTWRMTATIRVSLPTTDEEMKANWNGIFVVSFHIQQLSGEPQA